MFVKSSNLQMPLSKEAKSVSNFSVLLKEFSKEEEIQHFFNEILTFLKTQFHEW